MVGLKHSIRETTGDSSQGEHQDFSDLQLQVDLECLQPGISIKTFVFQTEISPLNIA